MESYLISANFPDYWLDGRMYFKTEVNVGLIRYTGDKEELGREEVDR